MGVYTGREVRGGCGRWMGEELNERNEKVWNPAMDSVYIPSISGSKILNVFNIMN